jgi:hypothetical protein
MENLNPVKASTYESRERCSEVKKVELNEVVGSIVHYTLHLQDKSTVQSQRPIKEFVSWYGLPETSGGGSHDSIKFKSGHFVLHGISLKRSVLDPRFVEAALSQFILARSMGSDDHPFKNRVTADGSSENPFLLCLNHRGHDFEFVAWQLRPKKEGQTIRVWPRPVTDDELPKGKLEQYRFFRSLIRGESVQLRPRDRDPTSYWYSPVSVASNDEKRPDLACLIGGFSLSKERKPTNWPKGVFANMIISEVVDNGSECTLKFNYRGKLFAESRLKGKYYDEFQKAMDSGDPFPVLARNVTLAVTKEDLDNYHTWKSEELAELEAEVKARQEEIKLQAEAKARQDAELEAKVLEQKKAEVGVKDLAGPAHQI